MHIACDEPRAVYLGIPMRKQLAGGAAVLLALLSLSVQKHTATFAAVTTNYVPQATFSGAGDYLSSVCVQGVYHWQKTPIKVFISSGAGVPGYRDSFPGMIRHAFDTWNGASGTKLPWTQVNSEADADVKIYFTDHVKNIATGTEAGETNAYTQLNRLTNQGFIYGAKMTLLSQLPERGFSDFEMNKTILHETGHALGLQGHSPNRDDIMYYSINPQQQGVLTARDEATMAHLYSDYSADGENVALGAKTTSSK
jgi:predicted Zn-dependent protease